MELSWRGPALITANTMCLLALLGLAAWTFALGDRQSALVERLHAELDSTLLLGKATGNYSTQLAQVLLLGRDKQADLRTARLDMERSFVGLSQATRAQALAATSVAETQGALRDVENTRRMLELYHAIDLAASRAIVLDRDELATESRHVYDREVDFRLTIEFVALLEDARLGIEARLQSARIADTESRNQLLIASIAAAALAAITLILTALTLLRPPQASLPALTQAFEAQTEELRDSNKRLRETDSRRAQFLADVSHELRTPLTILRGEADVALLPNTDPPEQRRSLERIQDQAAELSQLLDDLIAFARSDAEGQALNLAPVLLDDLLASAAQEGETLAEPREVTLDLTLPGKGVWVTADMRRLKQAVLIGIDNAINHSPPGTTIQLTRDVTETSARVLIADQGPGITAQDQPHLFDRFYRGRDGSGGSFGLGIGLAIAKAIVEQHEGTITLTNRAEGGAELIISLPLPGELTS